jgi:hypothetical protein
MTEENNLAGKFLSLPRHRIHETIKNFGLLKKSDNFMVGHDKYMELMRRIWKRMKKNDRLKDLWFLLNKDDPNYKKMQNPFEK